MATTVDALLPLSFLEAVRAVDRPDEDPDAEFVAELRNKRLGLSDTVYAQIHRYTAAARRRQRQGVDEVAAIARLIARRPDAEAVFRAAGAYLAAGAYAALPKTTRRVMGAFPAFFARPVAMRQLRRIARRYYNGTVRRDGGALTLEVPRSLTVDAAGQESPGAHTACAYYESAFGALLARLVVGSSPGAPATMTHPHCAARGDERCVWRAELRA